MTKDEVRERILNSFTTLEDGGRVQKRVPCRIRIKGRNDGKFVKVCSGKTIWSMPRLARCALRHHVDGVRCYNTTWGMMSEERAKVRELFNEVLDEMLASGEIEVVPI